MFIDFLFVSLGIMFLASAISLTYDIVRKITDTSKLYRELRTANRSLTKANASIESWKHTCDKLYKEIDEIRQNAESQ